MRPTDDRRIACVIWIGLALIPFHADAATLLPDRASLINRLGPSGVTENFQGFVFNGPVFDLAGPGTIVDSSSWPLVPGVAFSSINGGLRIENLDYLGRTNALSVTGGGPRSLVIDFNRPVMAFGFDFLPEVLTGTDVTLTLFAADDVSVLDTKTVRDFFFGMFIGILEPAGVGKVLISSRATDPFDIFTVRIDDLTFGSTPNDAYITRIFPPDVAVVDLSNGTIRRTIPLPALSITQETAVSPDGRTLYLGDLPQNDFAKVDVVDLASASLLNQVTVGTSTSDPIVDLALLPDGRKLYTANWTASTVAAVDLTRGTTSAVVPTPGLAYDVTSSPDGRRVYATALNSPDLIVIDATTDLVVGRINLGTQYPAHVAITPDGGKAYVTEYQSRVAVVDLLAGAVVRTIPFDSSRANPNNNALDIAIDPRGTFAYVVGYDTVNVIDLLTDTIRTTIPVGKELRGLAIDRDTSTLYVMTAAQDTSELPFTELVKIDTGSFTIADRFVIGGDLEGLAIGPRVGPLNQPPVADAGPDEQLECAFQAGAVVVLDGSRSSDPDSASGTNDDIASFEWYENFGTASQVLLGTGQVLQATLPLGPHTLTLLVQDRAGESDTDQVVMTVVDTRAPDVAMELTPALLWPPNHRLVDVMALVRATDACSTPIVRLTSITSSEPDDAPGSGDGSTTDDIQDASIGTSDTSVLLRAERASGGPGRVYTLTYSATDASGNTASTFGLVTVPHDLGAGPDPLSVGLEPGDSPGMAHLNWNAISGAEKYDVIRGDLGQVKAQGGVISLGSVQVLVAGQSVTSCSERPGGALPPAGSAFFYLVQYWEAQIASGWGTESSPWPEVPSSCDVGCP